MKRNKGINKRLYFFAFIIVFLFSSLVVRLFWIDFIKGDDYARAANNQRSKEVRLSIPRGMIYDRNLIPLVNRDKKATMFIFKDLIANNISIYNHIKNHIDMTEDELDSLLNTSKSLVEIPISQTNTILDDSLNSIFIANKVFRYNDNNLLSHVLGYVHSSKYTGELGIELGYDDILSRVDEKKGVVSITIDGRKQVIPGLGFTEVMKDDKSIANSVQLTIDYHIQKVVEEVIGDSKGAVVVAEITSGDIVAMASRPSFNQSDVSKDLESSDENFFNKAMRLSYNPGSIFKIVVLLSALENDLVDLDEKFICSGSEEAYGVFFQCNKKEGHGEITLEEGFAHSCNSVFIQLGKRLGGQRIVTTAKKLGLGQEVAIGVLEQTTGRLPEQNELLGAAIGNISIGQDKVEVTPLQVTNMMLIIANNGIQKDMSIIKALVTEEGVLGKSYNREDDLRVISLSHSATLKKYLQSVVSYGTARHLDLEEVGGAAGKTGSAQAGKENEIIHGWFSGYFPKISSKYVITVFVEEGGAGGKSAGPIFEGIAKGIHDLGR